MPISKNTKKKKCINDCGDLVLQGNPASDDFFAYSLAQVFKKLNGLLVSQNTVYTVDLYKCPKCGYIELYDR